MADILDRLYQQLIDATGNPAAEAQARQAIRAAGFTTLADELDRAAAQQQQETHSR